MNTVVPLEVPWLATLAGPRRLVLYLGEAEGYGPRRLVLYLGEAEGYGPRFHTLVGLHCEHILVGRHGSHGHMSENKKNRMIQKISYKFHN